MLTAPQPLDLILAKRALYQLAPAAQQITCRTGTLWITQDNDPRDIILSAGESFVSDGRHRAIAYALDPATLSIRAALPAAARRQLRRSAAASDLVLE